MGRVCLTGAAPRATTVARACDASNAWRPESTALRCRSRSHAPQYVQRDGPPTKAQPLLQPELLPRLSLDHRAANALSVVVHLLLPSLVVVVLVLHAAPRFISMTLPLRLRHGLPDTLPILCSMMPLRMNSARQ